MSDIDDILDPLEDDSEVEYAEFEAVRPMKAKINKEKFCKKNKLGGGKFGEHVYNHDKLCNFCGKKHISLKVQVNNN